MENSEASPAITATLQTFTVNLIGFEGNPQFVNPLALHSNGVVDEDWVCEKGVQIGLTQSSFSYTNGVQVEAFEDTVSFTHRGAPLVPSTALSAKLAKRYIDVLDAKNWIAISLEFMGRTELPRDSATSGTELWPSFADQVVLQGVQPRIGTDAFFLFPDRRLRVELNLAQGSDPAYLSCSGWVHRLLGSAPDQTQSKLHSVLDSWESDWGEVIEAASSLLAATLTPRGT